MLEREDEKCPEEKISQGVYLEGSEPGCSVFKRMLATDRTQLELSDDHELGGIM